MKDEKAARCVLGGGLHVAKHEPSESGDAHEVEEVLVRLATFIQRHGSAHLELAFASIWLMAGALGGRTSWSQRGNKVDELLTQIDEILGDELDSSPALAMASDLQHTLTHRRAPSRSQGHGRSKKDELVGA